MKVLNNVIWLMLVYSASAISLELLPYRAHYSVPVKSYREIVFGDVFRQQYDFSCGSAALASLLTFHYATKSSEQDIFKSMFEKGDKEKIKEKGFSLLDMKFYLDSIGLRSDGFQVGLEKIKEVGVPGITLVNFDGYMHFVVIRGINNHSVILGDPSRGTMIMKLDEFEKYYQGIVLLVRNEAEMGRSSFITNDNFTVYQRSPLKTGVSRDSLGVFSITLPVSGEN
ncbi:Lactococcin-G-processing and transport ATP-binding protein LagD [Vibrio alginolyticus]|uniref:Lactococcin-G-processing and transport ATP-binding protein LagD n=2 Tax=Vibrio TaxID=662 RepID=A0A1W6V2K3_VIBAL|nr:C39 family peptidase [Vibrio alginolyticus]ARO99444.1 Lactococcin-G-processing and transport ATP-binding protein LagD [Vibrio alginolyticus]ARP04160.1 Lactococcin-G-processing and transport ATP-binding protein LagD [Vibrio alginolyticus]ARP09217.1 Lactococcin-G-processing and transport ATP-binding protein LagD [Vibrio alginolyticus]ARP14295.1 Lactococcin-G-processing and transport ATP-binding protein LagD [Vibrio alginolyticus]ARP19354.1 Lactococcin-G-processing and transport ATP-binding pr